MCWCTKPESPTISLSRSHYTCKCTFLNFATFRGGGSTLGQMVECEFSSDGHEYDPCSVM